MPALLHRPSVHGAWRVAHDVSLGLGAVLAAYGLVESVWLAGVEYSDLTLRRIVVCLPLLALTVAYALTAIRKGITWRGLPFFAVSYVLLGFAIDFQWTLVVMKRFAPSEPTIGGYVSSAATIVGVVAVVVMLALNDYKAARVRNGSPTANTSVSPAGRR